MAPHRVTLLLFNCQHILSLIVMVLEHLVNVLLHEGDLCFVLEIMGYRQKA